MYGRVDRQWVAILIVVSSTTPTARPVASIEGAPCQYNPVSSTQLESRIKQSQRKTERERFLYIEERDTINRVSTRYWFLRPDLIKRIDAAGKTLAGGPAGVFELLPNKSWKPHKGPLGFSEHRFALFYPGFFQAIDYDRPLAFYSKNLLWNGKKRRVIVGEAWIGEPALQDWYFHYDAKTLRPLMFVQTYADLPTSVETNTKLKIYTQERVVFPVIRWGVRLKRSDFGPAAG